MLKYIVFLLLSLESCSQNLKNSPMHGSTNDSLVVNNYEVHKKLEIKNIDSSFLQFWEEFKLISKTRNIISFMQKSLDTLEVNGLIINKNEINVKDLTEVFSNKLMDNWNKPENIHISYSGIDLPESSLIIQRSIADVENPMIVVSISGTSFEDYRGKIQLEFIETKTGYKLIGYLTGPG